MIFSKIWRWMCDNELIVFLTLITFVILGYPLFRFGIDKSFFYSLDPDVVYVTNAILYTKYAVISYADHPGTPTIMLINYLFFPLRLIAKYILHQKFIQWSFDNYAFLTYYLRIFELFIFSTATFIFLKVTAKISKSVSILIFAWIAMLSLTGISWAISIAPENLSLFLTSLWLLVFVNFLKQRKYRLNIILMVISGFAAANKFTSIFLLVPSLFLPLFIERFKIGQKLMTFLSNILVFGLAFYLGIRPAMNQLGYLKFWVVSLFTHAGDHGTGALSVFDITTYSGSAIALIKGYPIVFIFICFTLVLGALLIIKKKINVTNPVVFLAFTSAAGIAVFAKYPLIHYDYVNILLITFCLVFFLSKAKISLLYF
jgi:hypothetical protein